MCSKRKDSDFNEKQIQRFIDAVICDLCAGLVKSFFAWFCILHSCIHVRSTSPSGTVVTTSMSHVPTLQRYVVPRDVDCVELFITVITVITVTVDISKVPQLSQVPQFPHSFWLEADVAAPPPSTKRGVKASASMERQERHSSLEQVLDPLDFCWIHVQTTSALDLQSVLHLPNLGLSLARSLVSLSKMSFWKMVGTFSCRLLNRKTR